jgi:hypothetical protein
MYRPAPPSRSALKWQAQKAKLLIEFTKLKEEDLIFEAGRKNEMIDRIGFKLGKTDEEMKRIFQDLE